MTKLFNTQRRRFIKLGIAGLLGLSTSFAISSCKTNTQQAKTSATTTNVAASGIKINVLRMGYQQAGDLVRVSGVLEKRLEPLGIKVEWLQFAQGPQLMEGMNVGKIDLGSVGDTPPIFAQAAGANIVYVVGRSPATGKGSAIAVPPESPLKELKDIKGQKVNFQKGSASHYFILRALDEIGLKYEDIQVISMSSIEARDAFLQGQIPVIVFGDPHLAIAEKQGRVRVLRTGEGLDSPGGYYIAGRKFATENPELLRIVIKEMHKIGKWAEEHPQETAKLLAPKTKLALDIQEKVVRRSSFQLTPMDAKRIKEQQRVIDYFYKNGLLPKPLNIQETLLTPEQYAAITPASLISQR
ncbi:sulfonate ABC transporter substrate-binding protein [Dendronalium sp. ChiSLP03b]|uniref:sulfonate ABC transporter substrate-binding protein n=1 Tax=Dendronalium sp. ChiSLP03b TaxID=3075381 RepID=UPI002AD38481|nr:sulfonate ABC transporter substrate-binding protein [Dendronalium sp. ChiSLP03b]MDZ8206480.1 sulfonate ABC transporter substrate-binding protein [Dendronalium sp. ChiSLP03b]